MNRKKLLRRLLDGRLRNVRFNDMVNLAEGFGFRTVHQRGSHRMLMHPDLHAMLNLQPDGDQAKPYQIRQMLDLVEQFDLKLED